MKKIITLLMLLFFSSTNLFAGAAPIIWSGNAAKILPPALLTQSCYGDSVASANLTIDSTSDSTKGTVFISPSSTGKISLATSQNSYPFQYGDFTATTSSLSGTNAIRTGIFNDSPTATSSTWRSFGIAVQPNIGTTASTAAYTAAVVYMSTGSGNTSTSGAETLRGMTNIAEIGNTGATGRADQVYGLQNTAQTRGNTTVTGSGISTVTANFNTAAAFDASSGDRYVGSQNSAQNSGSGTMITAIGGYNKVTTASTGGVTTGYGTYSQISAGTSAVIATAYGNYIDFSAGSASSVTNGYGLYISTVKGSNTKWSLYSADATVPGYHAGNFLIGTAGTAAGTLDVEGGTAAAATNGANIVLKAQDAGSGTQNGGNIFIRPGALSGSGTNGTVSVATTQTSYPFQYGDYTATSAGIGTLRNFVVNYAPTQTSSSIFGNAFVTQPNIGTTASTATYYSLYGYSGTGTAINNGATPNFTGVYGVGDLEASGTANEIVGVNGSSFIVGAGSATSVIGVKTRAQIFSTSTATNLKGFDLSVSTSNTASATNAYGFLIANGAFNTSTIGTMYGVNISNTRAAGASVTTSYGVYVGSLDATTKYSIFTTDSSAPNSFAGNVIVSTAGKGLQIKEGSNAMMGTSTLSAGTVTVSNTSVTANSRIFITKQDCSNSAEVRQSSRVASTSFTITSADNTDTCVVAWQIIEPAS
jgi:hypothetical protein